MLMDKKTPPRIEVVNTIKEWIASGELAAGANIPAERILAQQLHVQRPTIRRALKILESEGLVKTLGPRTKVVTQRQQAMAHSIVVTALPQPSTVGSPWGKSMLKAVMDTVGDRGYNLILIHPERATERDIETLVSGCPSGVVVPEVFFEDGRMHLQWSHSLARLGIPMVVYGGNPELANFDRVVSDHEHGAYELTRLLLSRGCRRILMLFATRPNDAYWVEGRRKGYERALAEAGIEPLPMVSYRPETILTTRNMEDVFEASQRKAASYLLEYVGPLAKGKPVDAVMTPSDGETFSVAGACRLLGVTPGKDVQIVGYDNYWREAWERKRETAYPLATVDKHNSAIGRELVQLLLDRIEGKIPAEPQVRVVPPQLLITEESKR